ncbi:MAG: acylphosphatase [Chloroflexota bacterium]|nr:acylphosphatase [Chloroflexota bacterium]
MLEDEILRISATIRGRVQNVGFRQFVYDKAQHLGLRGYVRNDRYDRQRVELVAEGPRSQLEEFERALQGGPPGAHVTAVEAGWERATGFYEHFEITY